MRLEVTPALSQNVRLLLLLALLAGGVVPPAAHTLLSTFCKCQHVVRDVLGGWSGKGSLDATMRRPGPSMRWSNATLGTLGRYLYARGKTTPYGFSKQRGREEKGVKLTFPLDLVLCFTLSVGNLLLQLGLLRSFICEGNFVLSAMSCVPVNAC